jgi:hypothetical protein
MYIRMNMHHVTYRINCQIHMPLQHIFEGENKLKQENNI